MRNIKKKLGRTVTFFLHSVMAWLKPGKYFLKTKLLARQCDRLTSNLWSSPNYVGANLEITEREIRFLTDSSRNEGNVSLF